MILRINLLPEAYREPPTTSWQQVTRVPLAWLVAGLLVGGLVLLLLVQGLQKTRLARLSSRIQELQSKKRIADGLRETVETLRDQQAVYRYLDGTRSRWAQHLNFFSNVMPEGVWFTELSVDQVTRDFTLQGRAIAQGGEEMVRIGQFVQDLKADAAFSSAVQDLQIEAIRRSQDGEIELIDFTILGKLTPPLAAQPVP